MPTYCYRNKVTNDEMEVLQKITDEPCNNWGEVILIKSGNIHPGADANDPVERVPNWQGMATIYGEGVYKQGVISNASQATEKVKSNVTRYTIKDIEEMSDED